ncbi:MAG: hypothetical protein M9894_21420 [Planctomycetes bacterium]|nr:hypothetical protein [Planctomycetota bacterium]
MTTRAEATRRVAGVGRCPFCHDDLRVDDAASWVACQGCLARHHAGCWAEAGRCAACRTDRALARRAGRRPAAVGLVTGLLFGLVGGAGLGHAASERFVAAPPARAPEVVIAASPAVRPRVPAWALERLTFLANEGRVPDAEVLIERLDVGAEDRAALRGAVERVARARAATRRERTYGPRAAGSLPLDLPASFVAAPAVAGSPAEPGGLGFRLALPVMTSRR